MMTTGFVAGEFCWSDDVDNDDNNNPGGGECKDDGGNEEEATAAEQSDCTFRLLCKIANCLNT